MTLTQLTYFSRAAQLQHFNRAAQELNISEPSLLRSIRGLEEEFGVILFERKGRNVVLTSAGQTLMKRAEIILQEVEETTRRMRHMSDTGGLINMAYVSPLATRYIPETVRAFLQMEKNRDVLFYFHIDITSRNIRGLKNGEYDLIFASYMENEPEIYFEPIITQEMVIIAPVDHPINDMEEVHLNVLEDYPHIAYDNISELGRQTREFFRRRKIRPSIICESTDENGIAALVAAGFGLSLIADVDAIYRDDISIIHLPESETFRHIVYLAYMRERYQIPAVKRLIRFVKEGAGTHND